MQSADGVVSGRDAADFPPGEYDAGRLDPVTGDALVQVTTELATMASFLGRRRRTEEIQARVTILLHEIAGRIAAQDINPWARLRLSHAEPPLVPSPSAARIGVFPLAANPIHWGHLLTGLAAMAHVRLDKVLYVIAPDSCPQEELYPEEMRRGAAAEAIALFQPLFTLVPAPAGRPLGGPASLFRLLDLNARQAMAVFYIRTDECGTLGSEAAILSALAKEDRAGSAAQSGQLHQVSVISTGKNESPANGRLRTMTIPAPLPEVCSAAVRAALRSPLHRNELAFLPACVFRHLRMLSVFD